MAPDNSAMTFLLTRNCLVTSNTGVQSLSIVALYKCAFSLHLFLLMSGHRKESQTILGIRPSIVWVSQDDSECRKCPGRANVIVRSKILEPLLSHYSSRDSLRKAMAWLVHFKKYLVGLLNKDPDSIPKGPLTVSEVISAESVIVKAVQQDAFLVELALVDRQTPGGQKKCIPWSSPYLT